MSEQWTFDGSPPIDEARDAVTLVEGSGFCISLPTGDIRPGPPHGLFFRDTRVLSRWEMRVDGHPLQPLLVEHTDPFAATFVCRARPRQGHADATILVERRRRVGDGMLEDIALENFAGEAVGCTVTLLVDADFADLFEVKEDRVAAGSRRSIGPATDAFHAEYRWMGQSRGVRVTADPPADHLPGLLSFQVLVPARGRWEATVQVQPSVNDVLLPARRPGAGDSLTGNTPERRLSAWRELGPSYSEGPAGLLATLRQSQEDLGVLRIVDARHPDRVAVAAGAPWFMTLFGRDSLLSAWMALPVDPRLALGTLQTLAHYQGEAVDPLTEEQPGRIMHELRAGMQTELMLGGQHVYYGTADATSLFVMLVDEVRRWGAAPEAVADLLPAVDRALDWIRDHGDSDGDGFVEYRRATDRGLVNQGWKDSWDGVNFASGRLAEAPIALAEVQGYTYAAYRARARFATLAGDTGLAEHWSERALKLKRRFNDQFWLADRGYYAVALDGDKRPVDALASNMGHCLWTGIVDRDKAASVAAHLLSPEMFSGWGIRTLATSMGAYNPMSYHNGSVWPHDTAIAVAGLRRYGFVAEAQRAARAVLDAAEAFGGRLPELFCGFDRSRFDVPVSYPTSCSPQAWAAAAPLLLLRALLGLEPSVPDAAVDLAPALPPSLLPLRIDGLSLGEHTVRLELAADGSCRYQADEGLTVRLGATPGSPAVR